MITKLLAKLKGSKQRRDLFVAGQIKTAIPFQVRALRDKKGWTQAQLGAELGMTQTNVSRLESPGYGRLNITTLQRIASVFDVALIVRFVPFSELMRWTDNLSPEVMAPQSFEEEGEALEEAATITATASYIRPSGVFYGGGHLWSRATAHQWYLAPEMLALDHDFITVESSVVTLDPDRVERMLFGAEDIQDAEEPLLISEIPVGNLYLDSSSTQVLAGVM
jgi:transcriptional regulator with XRE-family HTH domain